MAHIEKNEDFCQIDAQQKYEAKMNGILERVRHRIQPLFKKELYVAYVPRWLADGCIDGGDEFTMKERWFGKKVLNVRRGSRWFLYDRRPEIVSVVEEEIQKSFHEDITIKLNII